MCDGCYESSLLLPVCVRLGRPRGGVLPVTRVTSRVITPPSGHLTSKRFQPKTMTHADAFRLW